jgi:polar amino acid transport system permease protein
MTPSDARARSGLYPNRLARLPYWALALLLLGVLFSWQISTSASYQVILDKVNDGIGVTLWVTAVAFFSAIVLGLLVAFARLSTNVVIYQVATFYVELMRGVPMLVLLLYVAFVFVPGVVYGANNLGQALLNNLFGPPLSSPNDLLAVLGKTSSFGGPSYGVGTWLSGLTTRDIPDVWRAILALVLAYASFMSEIFRAGIQSIDRGQSEAARSLGMGYWQAMRYVILPQAVRNVLPALGNDLIAMLKDSSLVAVLGVRDITRSGQIYAASSFRYFETYNVIAFFYLAMTLVLSMLVRWLEARINRDKHR